MSFIEIHIHKTLPLKRAIEHFGQSDLGQLRFVTKFEHVDHYLMQNIMGKQDSVSVLMLIM